MFLRQKCFRNMIIKTSVSLFLLGLSFGIGPCLASCGPLLTCYIAATAKGIPRALNAYLLFSAARILVYLVFAVAIFFLNALILEKYLGNFSRIIYIAGGSFIILVGAAMLFTNPHKSPCFKSNAFIFGMIIGLMPCAGLLSALTYIGLVSKSLLANLVYGLCFGIGTFISPLIIMAIFAGAGKQFILSKRPFWGRLFNIICALAIIFLGIQLLKTGDSSIF